MNILIIGSGGREEALARRIRIPKGQLGERRIYLRDIPADGRFGPLVQAALALQATLVVVGPEEPLVGGIIDYFAAKAPSIPVFGPNRHAAELEGSKVFMKTRCRRWGIPTADFDFAGSYPIAEASIKRNNWRVVKADGLRGGKGVEVLRTEQETLRAARRVLASDRRVLLEERLEGAECSVMALCDGTRAVLLPTARDYKRAWDGNRGLNTGGMGAYAPLPDVEGPLLAEIKERIVDTLVAGMAREGRPYRGVLYAGIMLTDHGPKLLEVNCRFGDPEAQVVLPLIEGDFLSLLRRCCPGYPHKLPDRITSTGLAAVCVCAADKGYPRRGRRRLNVTALGRTVAEAREHAYIELKNVPNVECLHYRTDIAAGI